MRAEHTYLTACDRSSRGELKGPLRFRLITLTIRTATNISVHWIRPQIHVSRGFIAPNMVDPAEVFLKDSHNLGQALEERGPAGSYSNTLVLEAPERTAGQSASNT